MHWSERDILAMRWDRVIAYAEEIQIDLGQTPNRILPSLPEEDELARIMREEHAKKMEEKWQRQH